MNELAFLDASVAVGYLAGMPPEQATRATEITEGDTRLTVTAVCLVEVYFALATRYQFAGYRIVDYLTALVLKDNVSVHAIDADLLIQGLEMCRGSTRVSIGDALM